MIRAIIFDWGGVIVDAETKEFFPEARSVLEYCKNKGYRLALACIASKFEERKQQIEKSGLKDFFERIEVAPLDPEKIWEPTYKGKDQLYEKIDAYFDLPPDQVLIVDDRMVRGIRYAHAHGHPSIWVKNGKFAHELPNKETGEPTHTVRAVSEILSLL